MSSQKGQKQAVVDEVVAELPSFRKWVDNALIMLSADQLERIKQRIHQGILQGQIEYGKSLGDAAEVRTYARSMVMNHLKKAKELNGNITYSSTSTPGSSKPRTVAVKSAPAPKGVDVDLLPDDLKQYVAKLV